MRKKSLLSMLVALSLVAVIMVGATLAYLTDKTDEVVNTFTIGNVDIDLTEPSWDPNNAQDLEPGAEVAKDPIVTNTGKNDAYVAVSVDGMAEMAAAGFAATVNDGWVLVDAQGNKLAVPEGNALVDGIYVYSKGALAADEETEPALFSKVVYNGTDDANITYVINEVAKDVNNEEAGTYFVIEGQEGTYDTYEEAVAAAKALAVENTYSFDLVLKAYAIQTTGFKEAYEAGTYSFVAEFGIGAEAE